ncbi:MAG: EamA family transporter [Patescibacteria group bacterium]|jgi:drug/metabolite transporter (DMT)-like permease
MHTFLLALISPALWSMSNHIDKYLVSKYFKGGGTGALIIFSSIVFAFLLPVIYLFNPSVVDVTISQALFMMLAGIVWVFSVLFYLYAMQEGEATYVAMLFQTIPVFSFILGTIFLHEILSGRQITGATIVLLAAIGLSLELGGRLPRLKSRMLLLMLGSSFLVSLGWLILKMGAIDAGFWTAMFWTYAGDTVVGVCFITLIPRWRKEFVMNIRSNSLPVLGLNMFNEGITIIAGLNFAYLSLSIPLAILSTLNGFQPFFLFLYGIILTVFFPHISKESLATRHIIQKIIAVIIMIIGTYILNT